MTPYASRALLFDQSQFDGPVSPEHNEHIHRITEQTQGNIVGIIGHDPGDNLPELLYRRLGGHPQKPIHLLSDSGSSYRRLEADRNACEFHHTISPSEQGRIEMALRVAHIELGTQMSDESFGRRFRQHDTMVQCDSLGIGAPEMVYKLWDPDGARQSRLLDLVSRMLPDYSIQTRGLGRFDITRQGIDIGYGINRMKGVIQRDGEDIVYICPPESERKNDIQTKSGIHILESSSLEETLHHIEEGALEAA